MTSVRMTERMLPLYEAKMIHHYDHRWVTYDRDGSTRDVTLEEKQDPDFVVIPRYWVREVVVTDRLEGKWDQDRMLGWRDISKSQNERTMIASRFPTASVGHAMPIALSLEDLRLLQLVWSMYVFDFVTRQKVGGTHMTYGYLEQLTTPVPSFASPWPGGHSSWFVDRVDFLQSSASWGDDSRSRVRAEIDAAMFHVYGIDRDDVDYIMETFPIVKRREIATHGEAILVGTTAE